MSFERRFELPTDEFDVDLTKCENCHYKNCDYTCGDIGYCITDCGESYVVGKLLQEKGYSQVNIDWFKVDDTIYDGIELTKRECKKLVDNLQRLGYSSTMHKHPLQKRSICTVIIDNYHPIELAHVFMKLDVIT